VVIGKGPKALKVGADFQKRRPEFFGPADAGEAKYAPALERRRSGVWREVRGQHGQTGTHACHPIPHPGAVLAHHDHRVGPGEAGAHWFAQGAGRDAAPVTEAGFPIHDHQGNVLDE
jgi:hypothetical protein